MRVGHDRENLPSCWQEFNHINRYWDSCTGLPTAKILPGELYVTPHNEAIATVLGSCISTCIRDPAAGIGGMNHFMLPQGTSGSKISELSPAARFGDFAMEQLINEILRNGGRRSRLEFKIFGGGRVVTGLSDVGKRNIEFVKKYIKLEGFTLLSEDVGGVFPRKVVYHPKSGKVIVNKICNMHNSTIEERDKNYLSQISKQDVTGEAEFF